MINLKDRKPKRSKKPETIVFYGGPGVGKTTLAAEFPKALFVQTEDGSGDLEITSATDGIVTTADEFMAILRAVHGQEHDFETLVIDSLDCLEPLLNRACCAANGWQSLEDPGYGKGYVEAQRQWSDAGSKTGVLDWIEAIKRDRGMNIVLIAHTAIRRVEDPDHAAYDQNTLRLHKMTIPTIIYHTDIIGYVHTVKTVAESVKGSQEKRNRVFGNGQRAILFEDRPTAIAKKRHLSMPAVIELSEPTEGGDANFRRIAPYLRLYRSEDQEFDLPLGEETAAGARADAAA